MSNLIQGKYPIQPDERIDFIDILRGFAVFGILVANMASYSGHFTDIANPRDLLDHSVLVAIRFLITAKFYSLFSFLFGWGMSIQMDRSLKKGVNFTSLYVKRLTILLLIGIAHGIFIWTGDILTLYAILGFLLLLFRNRSEKFLIAVLIISLITAILVRAPGETMTAFRSWYENITSFMRHNTYPENLYSTGAYKDITQLRLQEFINGNSWILFYFGNVFAMFVLGLIVGKRKIFQQIDTHLTLIRKVFWFGLLVGVAFNALFVWMEINPGWQIADWIPQNYHQMIQRTFYTIGAPALMLFYCSGIILLFKNYTWRAHLIPLGNVGRMALTNYLLQSFVFTLLFYNYGLGLYGEISPTVGLFLTVGFFVIQIRLSHWWFERYRFGPMEWIWRTLTYGRVQPIQQSTSESDIGTPTLFNRRSKKRNLFLGLTSLIIILLTLSGIFIINRQSINISRSNGSISNEVNNQELLPGLPDPGDLEKSTSDSILPKPVYNSIISTPYQEVVYMNILPIFDVFDGNQALKQIETLTKYPYLGRQAGSPEGYAAGEYIAEQFENFGLLPFGDNGTYFQNFNVTYTPLSNIPTFMVEKPDGKIINSYDIYADYSPIVRWYVGEGSTQSTVYWVNDCTKDFIAKIDIVGKVVLCKPGEHRDWMLETLRNVREHGASGLLLIADPAERPTDFASPTKEIWIPETIPAFWIYPELLEDLLAGSGKTVEDLLSNTETFPLKTLVDIKVDIDNINACPGSRCQARNILGILPGRDPTFADEIVVMGAHYDHMGQGPDGTVWKGANDNASGVSILLEIARSWKELGYRPRRSVLFAAWDAEELGLIGSRYYIDSPLYPLENTYAMIQLDMVGIGDETLSIDGNSELSEHIQLVAQSLGIPTEITHVGGSDHTPFLEAGIPSSLLIWEGDISNHYHQPSDTIDGIDPEKMDQIAQVIQTTLLDIVESAPAIKNLLKLRAQAAESGDLPSFLSTSTMEQNHLNRIWFNDLRSLSPNKVEMEANDLTIIGSEAKASVRIRVEYIDMETEPVTNTLTATLPTHFSLSSDGWKWDGPDLSWHTVNNVSEFSSLTVGIPPESNISIEAIAQRVNEQYKDIADTLGLETKFDAKLYLLSDEESLQASTSLSLQDSRNYWVGPGTIKLVYSENITSSQILEDSVVKLVLADSGINEDIAPWLWHGLPSIFHARSQSIAVQERFVPSLDEALLKEGSLNELALSWAATDYLYKLLGWQGLGQFIVQLGQICQKDVCTDSNALDRVLLDLIKLDSQGFERAWRDEWKLQLQLADNNLNQVMSTRMKSIASSDEDQFLSTVDKNIPNLYDEERIWFKEILNLPLNIFEQEAQTLAILEDGSILARVFIKFSRDQSGDSTEILYKPKVLFSRQDSGYKWSGPLLKHSIGELVEIRYPLGQDDLSGKLLQTAEKMYPQLSASLGVESPSKVMLTLYEDADNFAASISLTYPKMDSATAWTNKGSNIKLKLQPNATLEDYKSILSTQLSRNILYQLGVTEEWLVNGVSLHLSNPYKNGQTYETLGTNLPKLSQSLEVGILSPLTQIQPAYRLSGDRQNLLSAQSWDAVDYLISSFGWSAILKISHYQNEGINFENAFLRSTGITFDVFEKNWRSSLLGQHITQRHVEIASKFDEDLAMNHIKFLTKPELAGRQAGSPGDKNAAAYIADKFREYGLVPASIQPDTVNREPLKSQGLFLNKPLITVSGTTYHQTVPISLTIQTAEPEFEIVNEETNTAIRLIYRQDFRIIQKSSLPDDSSLVPMMWVGNQGYQGVDVQDAIALRKPVDDISHEISEAVNYGASGLILVSSRSKEEEIYQKSLITNESIPESTIPVYELTQEGFNRILEITDQSHKSLNNINGIYPLDISTRINSHRTQPINRNTSNVLGFLPGSDPLLRQEMIIIGAHYDHVGDDLNGTRYSGANDDASGIAVLLEIARLWQEFGYKPKRSVLFAAWGAQELGNQGSEFYINHPTVPLEFTTAMIQLDGVGGGDGFNLGAQATWDSDGFLLYYLEAAGDVLGEKVVITDPYVDSDHLSFENEGLPTVLLSWRLANEDNLPDRLANKVHPQRLGVSGRLTSLLLMSLTR